MKHQYFADITDYLKYGLLRALANQGGLTILLAWMLTGRDGRGDGRRTGYLERPESWKRYDDVLFDALDGMLRDGAQRSIADIERSGLLERCRFFREPVPEGGADRPRWFERLLESARGSDVVFFDPDNGLDVKSAAWGRPASAKYLFRREVDDAWHAGHSVITIQFFPRVAREPFLAGRADELRRRTGARFVHTFAAAHAAFLAVPERRHEDAFERVAGHLEEHWRDAFAVKRHDGRD